MKETRRLNWRQACERLGCKKDKFYSLISSGELPAFRTGRKGVWVKEEDVEKLISPVDATESPATQGE